MAELSRPGRGAGWIEVIVGSMFSGKTEELLRRLRRAQIARQKVQVFKPRIDDRYSCSDVTSHNQQKTPSTVVGSAIDILSLVHDSTRVVGIDEGQFFDDDLIEVSHKLADRGIRVIIAGLDTDWRGLPFDPMPKLMAVAELVQKTNAICGICGGLASRTQRLVASTAQVQVGAADIYEARCRGCFDPHLKEGGDLVTKRSTKTSISRRKKSPRVSGTEVEKI